MTQPANRMLYPVPQSNNDDTVPTSPVIDKPETGPGAGTEAEDSPSQGLEASEPAPIPQATGQPEGSISAQPSAEQPSENTILVELTLRVAREAAPTLLLLGQLCGVRVLKS